MKTKRKTMTKPKRSKNKKMTAVLIRPLGAADRGSLAKIEEVKWSVGPDKSEAEERVEQVRRKAAEYWYTAVGRAVQLRLDVAMIVLSGMKARGWKPKDLAKRTRHRLSDIRMIMNGDFELDTEDIGELLYVLDTRVNFNIRT